MKDLNSYANSVVDLSISAIKEMALRSKDIENVASLSWGLPSFETPSYIREGVSRMLLEDPDIGKYTLPDGLQGLKFVVAREFEKETGRKIDSDKNVVICSGNMQALGTFFHTLVNPGDEIILTDPCFPSHIQQIKLIDGVPKFWPLNEEKGWSIDIDQLEKYISSKTKALVLVNPSNPTGSLYSKENLKAISELAKKYNFYIIIDDPYHHFIYDEEENFRLEGDPTLCDHILYSFSFSKAYAMSGWRLAYSIVPEVFKKQMLKVQDATILCPSRISQLAGKIALEGDYHHLSDFRNSLISRRELICERLNRLNNIFSYHRPKGAYYIFPKILIPHKNSREFSLDLLYDAKVSVTPGSAFGPQGEGHVRMAFCVEENEINLAFDRLEKKFHT